MQVDIHNPPLPITIDVTLFSEDVSYDKIAEVAKALETILVENDIPIVDYNIRILPLSDKPQNKDQAVSWVNSLSISDFPTALMNSENLSQVMDQFEMNRVNEVNEKDKKWMSIKKMVIVWLWILSNTEIVRDKFVIAVCLSVTTIAQSEEKMILHHRGEYPTIETVLGKAMGALFGYKWFQNIVRPKGWWMV